VTRRRELLLIRRAKTGPMPTGTFGRVELDLPHLYAVVDDPGELALHLYLTGRIGEVGPIPTWLTKEARDRVVAGERIPGVTLKREGEVKMRVTPLARAAGKDARLPQEWVSHLEVVQP
jgi:hypothetical protein